jgi:uncharacterized protein DUF4136
MRKLSVCLALFGALAVAPAFAQKVYIDYDKAYDRSKVHTYAWGHTDSTLEKINPRAHEHIVKQIDSYLVARGLKKVEEGAADVMVTYHTNSKEELSVNTDTWGYGYPSSFYWNPYWGSGFGTTTTTVTTYTRGTLIVDVWDAHTKKLVWRSSATDIVPENPEKAYKKIDKALAKIVSKWESEKEKEAKAAKQEKAG